MNILWTPIWLAAHLIMLHIFLKYGKPLEDDEKTLMVSKLQEIFEEKSSLENQAKKRQ